MDSPLPHAASSLPSSVERSPAALTTPAARRLFGAEELIFRLDSLCPMNVVVHADLGGDIDEAALRRGIAAAVERNPILRSRVVSRGRRLWLEPTSAEVELLVTSAQPTKLPEIYADEGNQPFDSAHGPLMRLALIRHAPQHATLVLTCHHGVADGRSLPFVLRDILRLTADESTAQREGAGETPQSLWTRFPAESVGLRGWLAHAKELTRFARETAKSAPANLDFRRPGAAASRQQMHIVAVELDAQQTRELSRRAMRERATVHAVLQASLAYAVVAEIGCGLPANALFATPVCLRARLTPPITEDCGYFVSGLAWYDQVPATTSEFWPFARRLVASIASGVERGAHWYALPYVNRLHAGVGRLIGARPWQSLYSRYLRKTSPRGVMVSYAGRFPAESQFGALRLNGAGLFANQSLLGNVAIVAITCNDKLSVDFVAATPDVSPETLKLIAERCMATLHEACKPASELRAPTNSPKLEAAPAHDGA